MIESDYLIGKSQQEVAGMLGEVGWLSWDFEANDYNPNAWNYGLGLIPGAFEDTKEDVEILFENDKVVKVILTQAPYKFEPKKEETITNKKLDSINSRFKQ